MFSLQILSVDIYAQKCVVLKAKVASRSEATMLQEMGYSVVLSVNSSPLNFPRNKNHRNLSVMMIVIIYMCMYIGYFL